MSVKVNTYILKGFDNDQNEFINTTIEYISSILKFENQVKIINTLSLKLTQDDFLILFIDELYLEQITQNPKSKDFFLKKEFRNNQIILILDDIELQSLPEYLQYFQTFSIYNNYVFSDDSAENWNNPDDTKSQLFNVINDIAQYEKRIKTVQNQEALTIYVGPSDDNTTSEYQNITRELLHRNYNVLPEISNPSAKEIIENQEYFKNLLESADLSIHFIGHSSILEYPEKSSSAIKVNKITSDFCNTPEGEMLQRIIYVPSEHAEGNEMLSQKILQFKSDTHSLTNAEFVQTPVEKFKELILLKLHEIAKPFVQLDHEHDAIDDVYFIYPPGLNKEIKKYTDWFEENELKYSESQIDLDQLELLNYHQKKLTTCKGVVIFNNGNIDWLNRKLSDIKKSPGWGRNKPFKLKAILGQKPDIKETNNNSFIIIDDNKKLDSKKFKELLFD